MWEKVKKGGGAFRKDKAGERFKNLHEHMRRRGLWIRLLGGVIGFLLTAIGFFLGFVPGIPGFVLGFVGIGLIAAQFRFLASGLDRVEISARNWKRKFPYGKK